MNFWFIAAFDHLKSATYENLKIKIKIMKKLLLTFLFALSVTGISAQNQNYKEDLRELLNLAKTDFISITGAKKSETDGIAVYVCTQPSLFGESGDIFKDSKNGTAVYSLFVKYNSTTEDLKKQVEEYIDANFPEKDYFVYKDIDGDFEEVSVHNDIRNSAKDMKQYLFYSVDTDPTTNTKTFELIIYGASAQVIVSK